MHRNGVSYSYPQPAPSHTRGHATSSAFSASAHPHEDWTKISDLAERRRIQNRIAQRNYRKKLKKRLEDLEKRASSNSASPEQRPSSISRQKSPKRKESVTSKPSSVAPIQPSRTQSEYSVSIRTSEPPQIGFLPLPEDPLFSEQVSRQLSHSPPPPVAYPMVSADMFNYATFSSHPSYAAVSTSCSDPTIYSFQTSFTSPYQTPLSTVEFPMKQELFSDVDQLNFNMGFAPLSSVELSQGLAFTDPLPQTPPLSDCFELQSSPSPPESLTFPQTPAAYPPSPTLTMI